MLQARDLKGRTAISYARWSSGKQAEGDSLRRQSENAESFCTTYGLTLDKQLVDDGVSAFKGANLEASLGQFVADVKAGKIANDYVLIVENIDRITRVKPTRAVRYFLDLLDTGLTLVTLTDGRVHTAEGYDDNFANLLMSLMAMQAAHEYSDKLSKRIGESWNGRVKRAMQGERLKLSKVPFWIDQTTQELNARANDARLIFQLATDGHGQWAITNHLNENGIPSSRGGTWGKSMVQDVLKSKAAYGSLVLKKEEVRSYFPPLITETEWLAIQSRQRVRHQNPQAGNTTNLFPRLLRCAHCGSAMVVTSSTVRGKTWRYLVCEGRSLKRTDCKSLNWKYDQFEADFLERMGFLALPIPSGDTGLEDSRTEELEAEIRALEDRHRNVLAGVAEAADAATRSILLDNARAISDNIKTKRDALTQLRESAARFQQAATHTADFADDIAAMQRMAKDDREDAKRLIANVVERIELESDSKDLRRAVVTLRTGYTHQMVFDTSGAL
ncbi:recombinase family protein [Mesorhizobium microcysteis]|uniref:Recombinase family protein n=1 Tax=Neoaquamicrobium microcysteis TaxID=2682781 RepID=A0A5D4H0C0_9HYPH|nr:recombinase family protein [Mesorhizobium microcysteis]TYR33772.1 recombinase family protein [Mesorhizobium microcysteis]